MRKSARTSCESLSLDECDRLVLSPPAVPFNPNELLQFLSEKRAKSAKHSLHSINTEDGLSPYARHVSIAWSQSEYDAKFKKFDPHPKSSSSRQPKHPIPNNESPSGDASVNISVDQVESKICTEAPFPVAENSRKSPITWKNLTCCCSRSQQKVESHAEEKILPVKVGPVCKDVSLEVYAKNPLDVERNEVSKWKRLSRINSKKCKSQSYGISNVNFGSCKNTNGNKSDRNIPSIIVSKSASVATKNEMCRGSLTPRCSHHDPDTSGISNPFNRICFNDSCIAAFSENGNFNDSVAGSLSDDSLNSEDSFSDLPDQPTCPGRDLLGKQSKDCYGKKCLVLDLDETLVHSSFKQIDEADFSVMVDIENLQHEVLVCKRPHLETFLNAIGPLFECVMFTASLSKYADPVCDQIDSIGYLRHRLFRESCVFFKNNYIKHLDILGRDIDQICIIDNSPISFCFNRQNAIHIVSWFDDPNDVALLDLIPYLQGLASAPGVINYLKNNTFPPMAVSSQQELDSWFLLPSDLNGYYEMDKDARQIDHLNANFIKNRNNGVITNACRPGETIFS